MAVENNSKRRIEEERTTLHPLIRILEPHWVKGG